MEWIKQFLISLVGVGCFIAAWLVSCGIGDFFWRMHSTWYQVLLALVIALIGVAICNIKTSVNYVGLGFIAGAVIGAFLPLYQGIEGWFDGVRNFLPCLGVCILYMFMFVFAGAAFTAGLKNAFFSLVRLDFLTTLLSVAVSIIGFYCALSIIVSAVEISAWMLFGIFIGLSGAYGGLKMPSVSIDDAVVYDGNGNMRFVASNISSDRVQTTDGEVLRKHADGNYR